MCNGFFIVGVHLPQKKEGFKPLSFKKYFYP
jgi:hypothetical protein